MRQYRVRLAEVVPPLWLFHDDLGPSRAAWIQPADYWTLFFLEHSGGLIVDRRTYPFDDGFVALIAPGTKVGFLRTGPNTPHFSFTFGLTEGRTILGLPALADLGDQKEFRRREAQSAMEWLSRSVGRGLAFLHNVLWDLALPPEQLRQSEVLQNFESLVRARVGERLSVAALATEVGVSQSQLLRLVRAEHGGTIQDFVRERRAEAARSLIVSTELPLKAIAARTGMADLQVLNKAIRATTGLSPRALRLLAQNPSPREVVGIPQ